jgi:hypothetical protein
MSPSSRSALFSGAPNLSAKAARGGASNMRPTIASVPATNEPMAETARASPARPLRAIWYPSMHVTTDAASPGMLRRIEVVDPPYMAP